MDHSFEEAARIDALLRGSGRPSENGEMPIDESNKTP
jgi:hypothetical protein